MYLTPSKRMIIKFWLEIFDYIDQIVYRSVDWVLLLAVVAEAEAVTELLDGPVCWSCKLSSCWVTSPTHLQFTCKLKKYFKIAQINYGIKIFLTSSWGRSGSLQCGHWLLCSTNQRLIQAKQQSLEQWGQSLASLSLSIQMKHLKTSASPYFNKQISK